jgi:hypothetical protein
LTGKEGREPFFWRKDNVKPNFDGQNVGKIATFCTILIAALLTAACTRGRIIQVTPAAGGAAFAAERGAEWKLAESLWDGRRDPQHAWDALVAYRAAAEEQPEAAELWTRYARACYFVATYTEQNQEWSNPERSKALYLEGARAAENTLRMHARYSARLAQTGDEAGAVRELEGPWTEAAFLLGANRGRWALSEGRRVRLDTRARLEDLMRAVAARDPKVFHGGPDRFLAVMFMVTAPAQPDSARAHFERATAIAPLYLANLTMRAEYLAVFQKDRAGFRSLLEEALRLPLDTLPEAALENEYEQARARELLSRQAELFP